MLCAPELKRLKFGACLVGVDSGPFQNLSHFSIAIKPFSNVVEHLLLQMPNLEKLYLWPEWEWTLYPKSPVSSGIQPAILPNLRFIEVRGWDVRWISAVLKVISPGPERNLHISPSMFTDIISNANATGTSIRRLQLSMNLSSLMGLWVKAWRGDLEAYYPDIGFATQLCTQEVFLSRGEVEFDIVGLLVGLLDRMNYQGLQILDLDLAERLPSSTWARLFGTLPSLTSIELSWGERELFGALIDGIGDALTPSEIHNRIESTAPAALPFQALDKIEVGPRTALYPEEDIEFILKCLRKRLDLGMGLKKLISRIPNSDHDDPESDQDDSKSELKVQLGAWWR